MREARLILPQAAAAPGNAALAYDIARRSCCEQFGGVTITSANGAWCNDHGVVIAEPVWLFDIACEDNATTVAFLDLLADKIGAVAAQECVYIRYPSGDVSIRQTAHLWKRAA